MLKQVTVSGSVLGTLEQMRDLIRFVVETGIEPQVGKVKRERVPMATPRLKELLTLAKTQTGS